MSHLRVWIHAIWSTKRRFPFLNAHIREKVFQHMALNARLNNITVDRINGYEDHVHVVIRMRSNQCLADIIHQLKGESSRWINKSHLTDEHFEWQTDYFACSVSEPTLENLRKYIDEQEIHHRLNRLVRDWEYPGTRTAVPTNPLHRP